MQVKEVDAAIQFPNILNSGCTKEGMGDIAHKVKQTSGLSNWGIWSYRRVQEG